MGEIGRAFGRPSRRGMGRGGSLAVVLAAAALILTLAFVLTAVSFHHVGFSARVDHGQQAQNLAESALALAIDRISTNRVFGSEGKPSDTLQVTHPFAAPGSLGVLTFDLEVAQSRDLPHSTNNLAGDNSIQGWSGRSVPPETVHLVAVGESSGVVRRVEAWISIAAFPYALACTGPFRSTGGLLVAGVKQPADVPASGGLDRDQLIPANVAVNATGSEAVFLGPSAEVTGNVQAAGGVTLEPTAVVRGEVRAYGQPAELPRLDLTSFDPRLQGKSSVQVLPTEWLRGPRLSGFLHREGVLHVSEGLRLERAVLYVDGDLFVEGGLQGTGAVFVTGATTIRGGGLMQTDNAVALASGGDLSIQGLGPAASRLRGLLYTEGNLRATGVTVVGSLLAHGQSAATGSVNLEDVQFLQSEQASRISFVVAGPATDFRFSRNSGAFQGTHETDGANRGPTTGLLIHRDTSGYTVLNERSGRTWSGLNDDEMMALARSEALAGAENPAAWTAADEELLRTALLGLTAAPAPGAKPTGTMFELDITRLLAPEKRMQILLWRSF